MSGFSSPTASPRARSRSRSNSMSPRLSSEKLLPSIPEDGPSPPSTPPPPPYANANLINSHLAAVVELVNQTSRAAIPGLPPSRTHLVGSSHQQQQQQQQQQQRQQRQHNRRVYQDVQYQYDPESHGSRAREFHEAARRRQHAQLAGLLLFGVFLLSCAGMLIAFITAAVKAGRQGAHDFEMRRQCFLTHNRASHCDGEYGRW
ncbi:hypothetical protein PpBr36_04295 [Pyricularia pennisetigena]|uniref:hypothetical protein n=1 Tax=Pyricularia pennisetigena TaxID=1578925 RepID=UPI00114E7597|nr:hypothetical protein PpBr36_04295 [Pyricularia pennisetigena]TLS27602.1 hypothetical protein PpBr36_04295 [Pyricularia pennisetigena]